jgi:hypothetical protein
MPCGCQLVIFNRVVAGPEQGEQGTPALPIRSLIRLPPPRRPNPRRIAYPPPGTEILHRAGVTQRTASPANQRAKLHRRNGPAGGRLRLHRRQFLGQKSLLRRRYRTRQGDTETDSGQYSTNIGIQHDLAPTVRETSDCGGGVRANSGKAEQRFAIFRHPAIEVIGDHLGCLMQPQGPARIAETAPSSYRIAGSGRRERTGRWPSFQPGPPGLSYALHRRLLEHELTDHDRPRCRLRSSPWQITRVLWVPAQDAVHHCPRPADRDLPIMDAHRHERHATVFDCSARCARSARIALCRRLLRRHSGTKSVSPRSSSARRRAIRV